MEHFVWRSGKETVLRLEGPGFDSAEGPFYFFFSSFFSFVLRLAFFFSYGGFILFIYLKFFKFKKIFFPIITLFSFRLIALLQLIIVPRPGVLREVLRFTHF